MSSISLRADPEQLLKIQLKLKHMSKEAPTVLKRAVNATARDAKTDLANKARETYAVKAPRFKKSIVQKNATNSKPVATLIVKGKSLPLADFKYRKHGGGAGAKAKVYKENSLKDLTLNGKLKAFVVKFKSGHLAVARRDPPNKYTSGLAARISTGGDRTKIKEFYSLSIPGMIGNERKVYVIVKPNIQRNLDKHVEREVSRILRGH